MGHRAGRKRRNTHRHRTRSCQSPRGAPQLRPRRPLLAPGCALAHALPAPPTVDHHHRARHWRRTSTGMRRQHAGRNARPLVHAACSPPAFRTSCHEHAPANAQQDPAAFVVRRDQGRVACVDGALPVRVRSIAVGRGRHPRQGLGHSALAHALPSVRPTRSWHTISRTEPTDRPPPGA